jgi:hypothetical protein
VQHAHTFCTRQSGFCADSHVSDESTTQSACRKLHRTTSRRLPVATAQGIYYIGKVNRPFLQTYSQYAITSFLKEKPQEMRERQVSQDHRMRYGEAPVGQRTNSASLDQAQPCSQVAPSDGATPPCRSSKLELRTYYLEARPRKRCYCSKISATR